MTLQPGDKLSKGKYTIKEKLKTGRFGITYLATVNSGASKEKKRNFLGRLRPPKQEEPPNQKPETVVIKTLNDGIYEQAKNEEIEKRNNDLFKEAMALSSCKHSHIVKFKYPLLEGGKVYLIMEHIAGDDLATLPDKTLPEKDSLTYIKQIGEALIEVHENELIHRDVKPANIILKAGKQEAILIDFGLARGFDDILTTVNPTTAKGFAPPELYDPTAQRGPYTDVYSLAATLYFLLTGKVPPNAQNRHKEKLVDPKNFNSSISDYVNKAIIKGMELDWEKRPQTMAEWLKLLPLPVVEKKPEPPNSEREALKLSQQQTIIGIIALVVGLLTILVTFVVTLYPQETREKIEQILPSPSPTPTPVESPSQE